MIGLLLLLSVLTLLGVAVTWWLRQSPADPGRARPVSIPLNHGQDLLPESAEGEDGLAAFYAYQIAAGKIDRLR